jgi:hypothetical protein
MSTSDRWPQAQTYDQAFHLKAAVDGDRDNYLRWVYRCLALVCATFLTAELMGLVL